MHTTVIDPAIRRRYETMKGREFAHDAIDPSRVAHLIIDMQNGFVAPGAALEVPEARTIVDNINSLADTVRRTGGINVYLQFTTTDEDAWPAYFRRFQAAAFAAAEVAEFRSGSTGHDLYPALTMTAADIVLEKTRFSAFTPGSSAIADVLTSRDIDTVIISGTLTDCCCAATAHDAQQLGYDVIFVSDATAALSDAEHNAAITSLAAWYADVCSTAHTTRLLRKQR